MSRLQSLQAAIGPFARGRELGFGVFGERVQGLAAAAKQDVANGQAKRVNVYGAWVGSARQANTVLVDKIPGTLAKFADSPNRNLAETVMGFCDIL